MESKQSLQESVVTMGLSMGLSIWHYRNQSLLSLSLLQLLALTLPCCASSRMLTSTPSPALVLLAAPPDESTA